jgi:pyruvate/2-oxoglutarate/acetoin dehydrogenase E1 component
MKYKDALNNQMIELAKDPKRVFIGYNLKNGSRCYGTMAGVSVGQIIEMPVAEALMAGMATGLALAGMKPVLIFERHDFMLLASDQIINHLDKIKALSDGRFNPKVIIRAIVGDDHPFDPGIQHLQNFTHLFKNECNNINIYNMTNVGGVERAYMFAKQFDNSSMCVEHKALYKSLA